MSRIRRPVFALLIMVLITLLGGLFISCAGTQDADVSDRVRAIARPYKFSIAGWELQRLFSPPPEAEGERGDILYEQIKPVIRQEGITLFPPLSFTLEEPPHLLVISPRDRIAYADRYLLRQELSTQDMESMEESIADLGMSALVVELGGFGATYPPIVAADAGLTFTINAILEEWLHQYLAFKPLGFRYALDSAGIRQAAEIIVVNETLAGMVSEELGLIVRKLHYPETLRPKVPVEGAFDFDAEMRITRGTADRYLAQGQIAEAERYMEERRLVFAEHGYRIRKLNQAYFAFHGIYGRDPASVSPAQRDLETLRLKSPSIKAFLEQAAGFRSYADLSAAVVQ